MKRHTQIALYVSALGLAIAALATSPMAGLMLLDSDAPQWQIELYRLFLMFSMTGILFSFVSFIFYPFVLFGLWLVGSSLRAKVFDYAKASMFGCAFAIALCVTTSQFEANRHPTGYYAATFQRVKDSAEESARNSSYGNIVWGQLRELQNTGALLVCAEYFVDHVANFVTPGILLPPMFLYIWKRRKNKPTQGIEATAAK